MKTFLTVLAFAATLVASFAADTNVVALSPSIAKDTRCFELRTYVAAPGKFAVPDISRAMRCASRPRSSPSTRRR